ncbi:hypothetical protein HBI37_061680 [Parastagonospora nodorum]|nr:hypothetical protein HBI37_061680 [Parastagonospora nodorum]
MRKVHTRPNLLFEYIQPKNTARHTSKAIEAADDPVDVPDVPRVWDALREPFMWQVRELGEGKGVKILWWFVAVVDGEGGGVWNFGV